MMFVPKDGTPVLTFRVEVEIWKVMSERTIVELTMDDLSEAREDEIVEQFRTKLQAAVAMLRARGKPRMESADE